MLFLFGSTSLEEAVFSRVSRLDSELCAQLTGMLLEMPPLRLARLLRDDCQLRQAVSVARAEYIRYTRVSWADRLAVTCVNCSL